MLFSQFISGYKDILDKFNSYWLEQQKIYGESKFPNDASQDYYLDQFNLFIEELNKNNDDGAIKQKMLDNGWTLNIKINKWYSPTSLAPLDFEIAKTRFLKVK